MRYAMTRDRELWITYLLNRAYPRHRNGTRDVGNQEFYAELKDQPDHVLKVLYDSAKAEEARRQEKREDAA